jgi:hypothetical protein
MSDEHADFLNGLRVVEYELERVIGELDEMQDRLGISTLDRVSLDPLQWALNKLADDLHDVNVEIRNARKDVASARREAEDAWEVRDAANEQHAIWVRKYDAEVERRLALEKQVAELTEKLQELPTEPAPEPYQWQVGDEVEHDGVVRKVRWASGGRGRLLIEHVPAHQQWFEAIGWKLHRKASELPDIPPFTEQQMADFKAVMEQVSDSIGIDGEGQS